MKMFIFEDVSDLTYNYHSGGGLVVVARDKDHALELISTDSNIVIKEEHWSSVIVYNLLGQKIEPKMYIFPDAGCC